MTRALPSASALTLDQLRLFATVAEEGSFSAAGRRLRRVQSAVSYGIANLEEQLGLRLFDRSGRRPVLTDAGSALLADARTVLARVATLEGRAAGMRDGLEAEVSLAVDAIFPSELLVESCRAFRAEFPDVGLRLMTDVLDGVTERVRSGEATLGITGAPSDTSNALSRRFLMQIEVVPVASADHPLAKARHALTEADLREEVQIVISQSRPGAEGGANVGVISERIWRVVDVHTKLALIHGGLGWGLLPASLVAAQLGSGRLARLKVAALGDAPKTGTLVTLWRTDPAPGPAATWLLDALPRICVGGEEHATPRATEVRA